MFFREGISNLLIFLRNGVFFFIRVLYAIDIRTTGKSYRFYRSYRLERFACVHAPNETRQRGHTLSTTSFVIMCMFIKLHITAEPVFLNATHVDPPYRSVVTTFLSPLPREKPRPHNKQTPLRGKLRPHTRTCILSPHHRGSREQIHIHTCVFFPHHV